MSFVTELGGLLWTILAFVVALSIIVAIHEYGHYIIGRISGIKADVFSIGFGPRLISRRDKHGTLWQVAAIPLGGYVRFVGDSNAASAGAAENDMADNREALAGAPLWARFATVAAGPAFNFILSIAIFAGVVLWQGMPLDQVTVGRILPLPETIQNQIRPNDQIIAIDGEPVKSWAEMAGAIQKTTGAPEHDWRVLRDGDEVEVNGPDPMPPIVGGVAPRSPAASAGLREGDFILSVNGAPVSRFTDLRDTVAEAKGAPVALQVWREGRGVADVTLSPREQDLPTETGFEKRWLIGVTAGTFFEPQTRSATLGEALGRGVRQTWMIVDSSVTGLWAMITGQIGTCNMGGAISIAESTGQAASGGAANFVWWIAVLSAAIGFLKLLPIPVLDGGHLAFYLYEAVVGRPASPRVMNILTSIGLALVLGLMVFGLSNDLLCR